MSEALIALPFGLAIGLVVGGVGGGGAILALPVLVYILGEGVGPASTASLIVIAVAAAVGGRPLTKRIYIPDAVFASRTSFLNAVTVGDTVFVNAYLIGTTVFGNRGNGNLARITSEFMAVELVHRALARQSLGLLGNDKVFAKYSQAEDAVGAPNRGLARQSLGLLGNDKVFAKYSQAEDAVGAPNRGQPGFRRIESAVTALEARGIGFGKQGSVSPGQFYDFDAVSQRTPNPPDLSTRTPR